MIFIERTINIKNNQASIEEPIVLYKGDKNIELQFMIKNNPFKYKSGVSVTYGQLVIKRPSADPIFSEIAKLSSGKVLFVVSGDMIDELSELGSYDFQIRLINTDKTSRGTIPPITAGIIIKEPLCEEESEGVNYSVVNKAKATTGETLDVFNDNGDYIKTEWKNGDIITDSRLNKIENALYEINDDNATEDYVNQGLAMKSDVNHIHDNYATEEFVRTAIENIQLGDDYATKTEVYQGLSEKAELNHNHDDIYATKEEIGNINTILDEINGKVI